MLDSVKQTVQKVRTIINHAITTTPTTQPHGTTTADGMAEDLTRNATRLTPLTRRHIINGLEGVPEQFKVGWARLPKNQGNTFSIGLFTDKDHFTQIALADGKARVFAGTDPAMDVQGLEPRFLLVKEEELTIADGARFGHAVPASGKAKTVRASQGGVVGRMGDGRMIWLASWLKTGSTYTLEQMRASLPESLRFDLEYRDALTIAFFAAYMLPQMNGLLVGFGSGNIFRRLNREAPIGAIRRSIRDTMSARSHGMRASGLEDYFADLMREAHALDSDQGLEAVHGAEPLHLYTSSYSGCYFFTWDSTLPFSASLRALTIEGNLNRFAAVSSWLERNSRIGATPTEDTVTRAQAAQIDMALLENPALIVLKPDDEFGALLDETDGTVPDGGHAVMRLVGIADETRRTIAGGNEDEHGGHAGADGGSEWVYRQTMARLLRSMRLPYRFDVNFRCNLKDGNVAIGFTSAGVAMMPSTRYDSRRRAWTELTDSERARMSADYNLRVGLMMAALSFGADPNVRRVSMQIDSIGLEEAIAEQDSAISELMSEALNAFERIRSGEMGPTGSKADPKDGDMHGETGADMMRPLPPKPAENAGERPQDDNGGGNESIDSQFEDLMRGIDFDDMTFATQDDRDGEPSDAHAVAGMISLTDFGEADDDPMSQLRKNPTVRNLVTVIFTREEFLERLRDAGLTSPADTYRMFDAEMDIDGRGALKPVDATFDMRDSRFSPAGSQEEPELADTEFTDELEQLFGCKDVSGLSIQRADLLQRAVGEFHRLAQNTQLPSVAKAQQAMNIVNAISDPELSELAPQATSALIDGEDTPDLAFTLADELDAARIKARDLLFSGQIEQAIQQAQNAVEHMDQLFASNPGVPRYFNSYAERVIYNRLFATKDEHTVLIPDGLFYAHMELADILAQIKGVQAALPHLNAMVQYAPTYPLSHTRLSIQLARAEDWGPARAACINALNVSLDREDAAYAYYRLAYAEWMCDHFDIAAAAYIMSDHIAPGRIGTLDNELQELMSRTQSQCIPVPTNPKEAAHILEQAGLPVWPHTQVADIVRKAARVCVDEGMFVPARTLSVAAWRMEDAEQDGADMVQMQFLRSLNN